MSTDEAQQLQQDQAAEAPEEAGDIGGCDCCHHHALEQPQPSSSDPAAPGGKSAKKASSRSFDFVMRSLAGLGPDEKLEALARKYAEVYDQGRASGERLRAVQKQLAGVARERDQLQGEHSKALLAKSKLEGLCRELQKHCKVVKDESLSRAKEEDERRKEEEERRKEVSGQLQTTISDIQAQMQEHSARNTKLRDENAGLVDKMRGLVEKYEKREEYVDKLMRQHELQTQLAEARLAQEKAQGDADRARMSDEIRRLNTQVDLFGKQEKALTDQIGYYTAKYEDFQKAITKSNEMFATFKTQIDDLTKKMRRLEKERNQWRERCEASGSSVLQLAEDKAAKEALIAGMRVKIDTLEKLCRALQLERRIRREDSAEAEAVTKTADDVAVPETTKTADGVAVSETTKTADGVAVPETSKTADGVAGVDATRTDDGVAVVADAAMTNDDVVVAVAEIARTDDVDVAGAETTKTAEAATVDANA